MVMSMNTGSETHFREFLNELTMLRTLFHPNIIPFYGLYCDQRHGLTRHCRVARSRYFLVSKFAQNGALENFVERSYDQVPFERRRSWTLDIAAAIKYVAVNGLLQAFAFQKHLLGSLVVVTYQQVSTWKENYSS